MTRNIIILATSDRLRGFAKILEHRRVENRHQASGAETLRLHDGFWAWRVHGHSAAGRSQREKFCAPAGQMGQIFHRANPDGPGRGRDAAANGDGHRRDRQRRRADAPDARETSARTHDGNVVQHYEPQSVRRVVSEATAEGNDRGVENVVSKDGTAPLRGDDELCRRRQNRHGAKSRERHLCPTTNLSSRSSDFSRRTIRSSAFPS